MSVGLVRTVYTVTVGMRFVGRSISKLVGAEAEVPQLELGLLDE